MKKTFYIILIALIAASSMVSCNKDLEVNPDETSSKNFPGVPNGEIVPVGEREATLTRTFEKSSNEINYWKYAEANAKISGCGQSETIDLLAESGLDPDNLQLAFGTDYRIYVMNNGVETDAGGWSWADPETKDAIILDKYPEVTFSFTALNKSEVVYASNQSGAYEDCTSATVITYERMVAQ